MICLEHCIPRIICLQDGFCVGSSSTPLACCLFIWPSTLLWQCKLIVTWLMANRGVVREIEKRHKGQQVFTSSRTEQWQLVLQTQPIHRFPTTSLRRVSVATTAPLCRSPTRPSFAWYVRGCYASLNWRTVVGTTTVPPAWKGGSRTRPAALCAGRRTLAHSETRRQRGESKNLR